jgi:hypothetical protein
LQRGTQGFEDSIEQQEQIVREDAVDDAMAVITEDCQV